jgi:hypothetical protein
MLENITMLETVAPHLPATIEELCHSLVKKPYEISAMLTSLELSNLVYKDTGGYYCMY